MSTVEEKSVAIIGGGLVGSLASLYLAQRGFHVKVFERRSGTLTILELCLICLKI